MDRNVVIFNKTIDELLDIADILKQNIEEKILLEKLFSKLYVLKSTNCSYGTTLIDLSAPIFLDNAKHIISGELDLILEENKNQTDKFAIEVVEILSNVKKRVKDKDKIIICDKLKLALSCIVDYSISRL